MLGIYQHNFFWVVAILASGFYGWKAVEIFVQKEVANALTLSQRVHQFWLNFVGAMAGWFSLDLIINRLSASSSDCLAQATTAQLAVLLVAFLGITGLLPWAVVGSVDFLTGLVVKGLKKGSE